MRFIYRKQEKKTARDKNSFNFLPKEKTVFSFPGQFNWSVYHRLYLISTVDVKRFSCKTCTGKNYLDLMSFESVYICSGRRNYILNISIKIFIFLFLFKIFYCLLRSRSFFFFHPISFLVIEFINR